MTCAANNCTQRKRFEECAHNLAFHVGSGRGQGVLVASPLQKVRIIMIPHSGKDDYQTEVTEQCIDQSDHS